MVACAAYGINRWLMPLAWKTAFFRCYFDDLLFIPAALPFLLWLERWLGTRRDDRAPRWGEIAVVFLVWSIAAEIVAPRISTRAVGDPWDAVAYGAGALAAGLWWNRL